ncbi:unnamed protein product, partial [Heterosigma akashiwo]
AVVSVLKLFQFSDALDKLLMLVGSLHAVTAGLGMPAIMLLFGDVMDKLGNSGSMDDFRSSVNKICLYFVYVAAGIVYCVFVSSVCWSLAGNAQAVRIRERYAAAVLRQEVAWFDRRRASELPARVAGATLQIQEGTGRRIGEAIQYTSQFVGCYCLGFYYSWKISLVIMAAFPLITVAAIYMQKTIKAKTEGERTFYAAAGGVAQEALGAARTVFSLNGQGRELRKYESRLAGAEREGARAARALGAGTGLLFACNFFIYALGYWYGSHLRANQLQDGCAEDDSCISGGDIITVFFSVLMGSMSMGQASPGFQAVATARAAATEVLAVIARRPEIDASTKAGATLACPEGRLSFRGVHFVYPTRPGNPVYRGLDLEVAPGESVALVGPSGEGKSTLIALVLRFYDPREGAVCLDGQDIRGLNLKWYRSQIGYVGQEPVLFAGTIRRNIKHGDPDASDDAVAEAAKAAHAHSFITLFPKQYDTEVGEGGVQLSGGQKQRIAIARALVKEPKILLLDEATSALDNESERHVQEALDGLQGSARFTTITVAHRLTTIRNCSRIAVISGGRVAELGSHKELMDLKGVYQGLCERGVQRPEDNGQEINEYFFSSDANDGPDGKRGRRLSSTDRRFSKSRSDTQVVRDVEEGEMPVNEEGSAGVGMGRLLGLGKERYHFLAAGAFGCLLAGGVMPAQGVLLARSIDMFYGEDPDKLREEGRKWSLGYAAFSCTILFANIVRMTGLGYFGERITFKIRYLCFRAFLSRNIGWFDREENSPGELTERLEVAAGKVHAAAGGALGAALNSAAALAAGLALALAFSWQMALATLAVVPFMALGSMVMMKVVGGQQDELASKTKTKKSSEASDEAGATISAAIQGIRTVHAFGMEKVVADEYALLLEKNASIEKKAACASGAALGYGQGAPMMFYAFLFWFGAFLIAEGDVTFEAMMSSLFALMTSAFGMADGAQLAGDQAAAKAAAKEVFALIDDTSDNEPKGGQIPKQCQGTVRFQGVRFAYPERPDVLVYDGFNLSVGAGQTVALCGPSGGGKSTCMALLLGFYRPLAGSITLDGRDIRDLDLRWLRAQLGYVGQEPVLFSGTIRSNIVYSVGNVDDTIHSGGGGEHHDKVVHAAKAAKAHEFVMQLKGGYDADVGEKSMLISGGQKQRLAIARAIMKSPKVLLLDEATSALDNENEKLVQAALDNLQRGGRFTTLVIAHRLSTIQNADAIAVIESGHIVEMGTDAELMNRENGSYKAL